MSAVQSTTLALETQRLLQEGRVHDALGVYWLAGLCRDGAAARDFTVLTVCPGLQLHYCGKCGRPAAPNRARVLGDTEWAAGDVAVHERQLVMLTGAPGPTGDVRVTTMDDNPLQLLTHVALLNLEN